MDGFEQIKENSRAIAVGFHLPKGQRCVFRLGNWAFPGTGDMTMYASRIVVVDGEIVEEDFNLVDFLTYTCQKTAGAAVADGLTDEDIQDQVAAIVRQREDWAADQDRYIEPVLERVRQIREELARGDRHWPFWQEGELDKEVDMEVPAGVDVE